MRTGPQPFHTPPRDGEPGREGAVRCTVHLHMPTWRQDGTCTLCDEVKP